MSTKAPPVPPANQSTKGPGSATAAPKDTTPHGKQVPSNLNEQDHEGNIHQNATNQGHQQDR